MPLPRWDKYACSPDALPEEPCFLKLGQFWRQSSKRVLCEDGVRQAQEGWQPALSLEGAGTTARCAHRFRTLPLPANQIGFAPLKLTASDLTGHVRSRVPRVADGALRCFKRATLRVASLPDVILATSDGLSCKISLVRCAIYHPKMCSGAL